MRNFKSKRKNSINKKICCSLFCITLLQGVLLPKSLNAQEINCLSPKININKSGFDVFLQKSLNQPENAAVGLLLASDGVLLLGHEMILNPEKAALAIYKLESKSIPGKYRWKPAKIQKVLNDGNYITFIMVENKQIIGYAIFDLNLNTLSRIGVLDQNKGKGSKLFESVIAALAKKGIKDFSVLPLNTATRFYRAFAARSNLVSLAPESSWIIKYTISSNILAQQAI